MKTNEFYGLQKKSFPKHKQWAVDYDYINGLTPEDKVWLGRFNQEYYRNRIKKSDPKALHNTDTLRRSLYSRENSANRDLYAIKETANLVIGDQTISDSEGNCMSLLDTVPDYDVKLETLLRK